METNEATMNETALPVAEAPAETDCCVPEDTTGTEDTVPSDKAGLTGETAEMPPPGDVGMSDGEASVSEAAQDAEAVNEILECLRGLEQYRRSEQTAFLRERALEAIGKMDPSVRSMEDLFTMEGSERFYDLVVHHGVDWENAYRAVKFDTLIKNAEQRGAQMERNRILSRSHLETTKGRGGLQDHVPTEIMAIYRAMNPTASEAEIIRHYNQTKN